MSDPIRERFAAEHGMTDDEVRRLAGLARRATDCNTRECNGDPHPQAKDMHDKNECASLWGRDQDKHTNEIRLLVETHGLSVEYTGLRPCLRDAAGHYIEIPH